MGLVYHRRRGALYRMVCYHYSTGRIQEAYQLLKPLDKMSTLPHFFIQEAPSLERDRNIVELIDRPLKNAYEFFAGPGPRSDVQSPLSERFDHGNGQGLGVSPG